MSTIQYATCIAGLLLSSLCAAQPARVDVPATQQRMPSVNRAAALSSQNAPKGIPSTLSNPFASSNLEAVEATVAAPIVKTARPSSDRDFLALLASQLAPTGTFILNGEPIILFGQKRMKVGDKVPLYFESSVYELEIAGISQTSFTVRFKNEELTRQISAKSSKNP